MKAATTVTISSRHEDTQECFTMQCNVPFSDVEEIASMAVIALNERHPEEEASGRYSADTREVLIETASGSLVLFLMAHVRTSIVERTASLKLQDDNRRLKSEVQAPPMNWERQAEHDRHADIG